MPNDHNYSVVVGVKTDTKSVKNHASFNCLNRESQKRVYYSNLNVLILNRTACLLMRERLCTFYIAEREFFSFTGCTLWGARYCANRIFSAMHYRRDYFQLEFICEPAGIPKTPTTLLLRCAFFAFPSWYLPIGPGSTSIPHCVHVSSVDFMLQVQTIAE